MTITEFKTVEITTENAVTWLKWINQSFDLDMLGYYFGNLTMKPVDVQQIDHVLMVHFKSSMGDGYVCLYNTNEPSHLELIQLEVKNLQKISNERKFEQPI